jgi:hypothetical protein
LQGDAIIEIEETWDEVLHAAAAPRPGAAAPHPHQQPGEELHGDSATEDDDFDELMRVMEDLELEEEAASSPAPAPPSGSGLKRGFLLPRDGGDGTSARPSSIQPAASKAAADAGKVAAARREAAFTGVVVERQAWAAADECDAAAPDPLSTGPAAAGAPTSACFPPSQQPGELLERQRALQQQPGAPGAAAAAAEAPPARRVSKFKQRMQGECG